MFRHPAPGLQPTWMRLVYLTLTTFLGLVLSFGFHAVFELFYLHWAETNKLVLTWTNVIGTCALPLWVQFVLPFLGLVGGYFQGRVWWQWVYVERRWVRK